MPDALLEMDNSLMGVRKKYCNFYLWSGNGSDAPEVTTGMVTLLSSKIGIFHCTPKDQRIHMNLFLYY